MVRLLAFVLFADPRLAFGKGLSTEGEPDLWLHDPTGVIELWIDVGLPDERELRKACGRARQVVVLAYGAARRSSGGRRTQERWRGCRACACWRCPTKTASGCSASQRARCR